MSTICLLLAVSFGAPPVANATQHDILIDDFPLSEELHLPSWFSLSFLDLQDSLDEALEDGKKGLIIYFGRKDCAYCKSLLEVNWGDPAIVRYTQKHFNVIAIDVRGARTVTDFNGKTYTEKQFATLKRTNFTPSLLFYNAEGRLALKLPGYRPKYQFRAALEYVADAHYRNNPFRQYLAKAEAALSFGSQELNEADFFQPPPYQLDRSIPQRKGENRRPLVVFFEHPRCHACDVLHGTTLSQPEISAQLHKLDVIQLDTTSDTPLITPLGEKTTVRDWADQLNLTFAPAILFFDANGKEILRVESVIRFFRLNNVLRYISDQEYLNFPTFQSWLQHVRNQKRKTD